MRHSQDYVFCLPPSRVFATAEESSLSQAPDCALNARRSASQIGILHVKVVFVTESFAHFEGNMQHERSLYTQVCVSIFNSAWC